MKLFTVYELYQFSISACKSYFKSRQRYNEPASADKLSRLDGQNMPTRPALRGYRLLTGLQIIGWASRQDMVFISWRAKRLTKKRWLARCGGMSTLRTLDFYCTRTLSIHIANDWLVKSRALGFWCMWFPICKAQVSYTCELIPQQAGRDEVGQANKSLTKSSGLPLLFRFSRVCVLEKYEVLHITDILHYHVDCMRWVQVSTKYLWWETQVSLSKDGLPMWRFHSHRTRYLEL